MTPTARAVAADVLHLARSAKAFAADAMDDVSATADLSPQDRRFVTQLVFGVLRRQGTLDALLTPFVTRPPDAVEPRVWDVLRLGAFQLAFLTQVPPHAALFETVELARYVGSPMAKGFVNGVLRRVSELVTGDFGESAAADALPFEAGRYRKLTKPVLPDPKANAVGYLAAGFGWPAWLADRWLPRYGWDESLRLGFWFASPPPLWLRVNRRRTDRAAYLARLTAANIPAEPGPHPESIKLLAGAAVRDLPGYADGDFAVQDATATAAVAALAPKPGMTVLDLCAAPGGKTTHLAELMDDRGRVVACDIEQHRLDTVTSLCQRLKLSIVEPVLLAESDMPPAGPFDCALADVPCSNTGVLGRRPEVRWRLQPREFPHLVRLQTRLLLAAYNRVKPGGVVVYSTCSIEPEENAGVVAAARRVQPGMRVEAEAASAPGRPADGGYWARLRKPG